MVAGGWQSRTVNEGTLFEKDGAKWYLREKNSSDLMGLTAEFIPGGRKTPALKLRLLE